MCNVGDTVYYISARIKYYGIVEKIEVERGIVKVWANWSDYTDNDYWTYGWMPIERVHILKRKNKTLEEFLK